ncbi:MAG: BTAD domain-containing putative transcriptional regulator, partial [Candidatus Eremiobacterota bacterium]
LQRALEPALERPLGRLIREFPGEVRRALRQGQVGSSACRALVGLSSGEVLEELATHSDPEVSRAARSRLQGAQPGSAPPLLRLYSLGAFEVYCGDEPIPPRSWRSQKIRYLLACLAAHSRPVSEDLLMEEFWPEDPDDKARQSLNQAASVLRRVLRPSDRPGDDFILRVPGGLQLNPQLARWHDLDELRRGLAEASRLEAAGTLSEAAERWRGVFRLWRGDYLEGCYMEWALALRSRLDRELIEAVCKLAVAALQQGRPQEGLEYARRVLDSDPCCQEAHLAVMQANLAVGRPEEAVRQYEVCCRALRRDLGMEPGIPILEAHQRALLSLG